MKVGDTVIYLGEEVNGVSAHPAVITRVWGNEETPCVNLHVFWDGMDKFSPKQCSVHHYSNVPAMPGVPFRCWISQEDNESRHGLAAPVEPVQFIDTSTAQMTQPGPFVDGADAGVPTHDLRGAPAPTTSGSAPAETQP